jgi:hypothetical protein
MDYPLIFTTRAEYSPQESGLTIEVTLQLGEETVVARAKIDTGAQVCLFQREIGEQLGLNIESGHRCIIDTLAGSLLAYGHFIRLHTLGLEFDSIIYFAANPGLPRNLLGREGWLQKVKLAVIDYDTIIYLSHYDYT